MLFTKPDRVSDAILAGIVAALWFGASAAMLADWAAPNARLSPYDRAFGVIFILVLIAWLWRAISIAGDPPAMPLVSIPRLGSLLTVILTLSAVLLLFLISFATHPQLVLITALTLLSANLIVLRRSAITGRSV